MFILIGESQAKGITEHGAVSNESATTIYRNGEPLMLVGCQRMRSLYTLVKRRNAFIQDTESAISSINVQPEPLLRAQVSKFVKRINRSSLDSSGSRHNTERP